MIDLSGKKALITGGSRGIGAAVALRLAEQGADVAITYASSEDEAKNICQQIETKGRKAFMIKADGYEPEKLAAPIESAIKQLGGHLDILVNNAGTGKSGSLADMPLEIFDEINALNVRAVYETTFVAQKYMGSGGRIILIGSILGERAIFEQTAVYNSSKFAVAGLGRSWAWDLAPRNITVNIVQPGPVDTDLNPADSDHADEFIQMTPLKRYGRPEEIANVVAFLASNESSYVTGATFNVDGGVNA